jgi:TonB-dependent SusC/RagA subfamily outer membrane receptor
MITKIILECSGVNTVNDINAVKVDLEDDGRVIIYHTDRDIINKTAERIKNIAREVEIGKVYTTKVVDVEDLLKKNYNTYSMDNMQGYVGGWNGNSLWGMDDYLVLIDGVPRDANNVLPTEIDKITFLKSASAVVLYGSRGAKGVISITTKRGRIGDRVVSVRANTGYNVAKSYPKYLGSAEYMTLYNEALTNDGLAGPSTSYSDEAIYNHSTGLNPYRYPDLNFYSSDYLRKSLNRSDVTAEISGGNDRAQFYTNVKLWVYFDSKLRVFRHLQESYSSSGRDSLIIVEIAIIIVKIKLGGKFISCSF